MAEPKKIFRLTAVQETEGKKYFADVGRVILHANGENGIVFLNMFPGVDYPFFLKKAKVEGEPADNSQG